MQRDNNQELFDYIHNELGVTALSSQMGDIECIVLGKEEYIRQQNEIMNHLPSQEDKPLVVEGGSAEHRDRLAILEKCMGSDFYKTGQYHNAISDAMELYRTTPPPKAPIDSTTADVSGQGIKKEFYDYLVSNDKLFYVDEVRAIMKRYDKEEISLSKFVELLNEKVFYSGAKAPVEVGAGYSDGKKYVLDVDFNNASVVTLVSHGKYFAKVRGEESEWEVMLNRLSFINSLNK